MAKIQQIIAREILSSGSTPSVEVKVVLETGTIGAASVPYGASAGISEAFVLLDGDKSRFMGKGMLKAVENVNKIIAPVIIGMESENQQEIDKKMIELDGSERKTNLGANKESPICGKLEACLGPITIKIIVSEMILIGS